MHCFHIMLHIFLFNPQQPKLAMIDLPRLCHRQKRVASGFKDVILLESTFYNVRIVLYMLITNFHRRAPAEFTLIPKRLDTRSVHPLDTELT